MILQSLKWLTTIGETLSIICGTNFLKTEKQFKVLDAFKIIGINAIQYYVNF